PDSQGRGQQPELVERAKPPGKFFWKPTNTRPKPPEVRLEERRGITDVSFRADAGETIALVGPSGAGKTTIINLIPRFYDPAGGTVRIDGVDIRDYRLEDLRKHIAIVLQDNILFSGTIRDNLTYGRPDCTEADMIAASESANAHAFIMEFADGYD